MKSLYKNPVLIIFVLAFLLRVAFSFYFQKFYFGKFIFEYKDSLGYINPMLNFINHHTYIGDIFLEDSKYFRVPVYPSFLGVIYTLAGSHYFDYAVALIQSLLDSVTAILIYLILLKITNNIKVSVLSGILYATYPFVIVWNPILYTEVLQTFIIFYLIYFALYKNLNKVNLFIQGVFVGLLILTKQYLGLFIFIPIIATILSNKIKFNKKIILSTIAVLGMIAVLTPWTIRNYIQSNGKIIVLKGESMGLRTRGLDFEAFEKFANLFNENITPLMSGIVYQGDMNLTKHPEFVKKHQKEISQVAKLAHKCGPSFMQIRNPIGLDKPPHRGCTKEVVQKFNHLTKLFWKEVPLYEALETRFDSFKKIFFKSAIVNKNIKFSKTYLLKYILFKYRVLLIILGFIGIFMLIINKVQTEYKNMAIAIAFTALSFYIFFTFVIVHAEIRYLLVPDLLFSIFASIPIISVASLIKKRMKR